MNTKKHLSLLVVLAMIGAYAIPFGGAFAADASWSASADSVAGEALMEGLSSMIDLTYTAKERNFDDGSSFGGYISHSDTSGGWTAGAATGTALKYEALESGTLTVYVADVKNKTVYLIEECAAEVIDIGCKNVVDNEETQKQMIIDYEGNTLTELSEEEIQVFKDKLSSEGYYQYFLDMYGEDAYNAFGAKEKFGL